MVVTGYLGLSRPALPAAVHLRNGLCFDLDEFYDLETLWQVWFRRVYDVRRSDRTVVDAGANIGLFSAYASAEAPGCRVWAIEPFPATFERLRRCVLQNGLAERVECSCLALAGKTETRAMVSSATGSELNRLLPESGAAEGAVPVPALTLTEFLDRNRLDSVDLLKIDIEGSEYEVLGATEADVLRRIRRLNVEYHAPQGRDCGSKQSLIGRLSKVGFRLVHDTGRDDPYGIAHFDRH